MQAHGETLAGHAIRELVTVNGVRVVADDGTWGLVRASSNKPELVVVVESPVSEARMREMFAGGRRGAPPQSGRRRLQPDDLKKMRCRKTGIGERRRAQAAAAILAAICSSSPRRRFAAGGSSRSAS